MVHITALLTLSLCPGFLKKIECSGRILASSLGSTDLVELAILPKEVGCAAILRPRAKSGETNLLLETSSGSHLLSIQIDQNATSKCSETVRLTQEIRK